MSFAKSISHLDKLIMQDAWFFDILNNNGNGKEELM